MQKMSRRQIGKYIQRIGVMLSENHRLSLIMECRTYLDIIAQHGQPSDTFSLLDTLATIDGSEPLMLRINKVVQTIVTLITKPTVRTQRTALEKNNK